MQFNIQLRHKVLLLAILPMLVSILAITLLVLHQNQQLAKDQITQTRENVLALKKQEIKNYVELALSATESARKNIDVLEGQIQAKKIWHNMNYGADGYFFAYNIDGDTILHPRKPELVETNQWLLQDPQGVFVVQKLLKVAQEGGGYVQYQWEKPSVKVNANKLAYVVMIPEWHGMIGTGVYLDDIEALTDKLQADNSKNSQAVMWKVVIIACTAILLVFLGGVILNVGEYRLANRRLKLLNQKIVNLQEEERSRVARELHDGISQQLVSVKYHFESIQQRLVQGEDNLVDSIDHGVHLLTDSIVEVRRISHDLHPAVIDNLGLGVALKQLCNDFSRRTRLKLNSFFDEKLHLDNKDLALCLYRVAQEALNNIERHAKANEVWIKLSIDAEFVELSIQDDGIGFNRDNATNHELPVSELGIGLRNMRERIEHFGGYLKIQSRQGKTKILVVIAFKIAE